MSPAAIPLACLDFHLVTYKSAAIGGILCAVVGAVLSLMAIIPIFGYLGTHIDLDESPNKRKAESKRILSKVKYAAIGLFLFVLGSWLSVGVYPELLFEYSEQTSNSEGREKKIAGRRVEHPGEYGDMFGSANALFSSLAFAGVVLAIILQSLELRLQREEIEEGHRIQQAIRDSTDLKTLASLIDSIDKIKPSDDAEALAEIQRLRDYVLYAQNIVKDRVLGEFRRRGSAANTSSRSSEAESDVSESAKGSAAKSGRRDRLAKQLVEQHQLQFVRNSARRWLQVLDPENTKARLTSENCDNQDMIKILARYLRKLKVIQGMHEVIDSIEDAGMRAELVQAVNSANGAIGPVRHYYHELYPEREFHRSIPITREHMIAERNSLAVIRSAADSLQKVIDYLNEQIG